MTWRKIVKSGKSSPSSPIASGLHSFAASVPVLVSPSGTTAAVSADAAVPMLNRVLGVTGVRVTTSLHPNPSAQTMVPSFAKAPEGKPTPTATDTPGRFCSNTTARTSSRARWTAAAYCGDGAESMTDGTSCDCAKRGALTTTSWVRNAANAATTTPTASAVRAAHIGSRLRAALTPSTTPTTISSMPMTAAPGASSALAT